MKKILIIILLLATTAYAGKERIKLIFTDKDNLLGVSGTIKIYCVDGYKYATYIHAYGVAIEQMYTVKFDGKEYITLPDRCQE